MLFTLVCLFSYFSYFFALSAGFPSAALLLPSRSLLGTHRDGASPAGRGALFGVSCAVAALPHSALAPAALAAAATTLLLC